ncbi:MAG: amidohydrolase family protein, partial [Thermoanaerobaculia bacterium]|nr:amidohydrolase family protein [Thermoanaerobaculia bacterium]
ALAGTTSIDFLDGIGLLRGELVGAHVVAPGEGEIGLLAQRGVGVVHCPQSNMKIAAGVAPVPAMIAAGVAVGLGTDGAGSNNDLDLWQEIDSAAKLHKLAAGDPTVLDARQAMAMATREGARALDLDERVGSLEVGKAADLIVVRADAVHQVPQSPARNPYSLLTYATKAADVETVMVGGRFLMREGRLATLDEASIVADARRLRARVEAGFGAR